MIMMRKQYMACLSLLVMVILQLESPMFFADGSARFNRLISGSSSNDCYNNSGAPIRTRSDHRVQRHDFVERRRGYVNGSAEQGGDHGDGDDIWLDEKRRIHTGPNPLHNR